MKSKIAKVLFILAALLAIAGGVAAAAGKSALVGPSLSAALLCVAGASMINPGLRPWSYTIWVATAVVVGLTFPQWFIGVGNFKFTELFTPLLMLIMFGMGTTMSLSDFTGVFRMPMGVMVGLLCQFTIMPLLGYAVAIGFGFPSEIAAGIVLVGVAPSGLASNVMCFIAKANLPLSITITAVASMLSPFLTPLLMKLLAGQLIEIDAVKMLLNITKMVVAPLLGGLAFHHLVLVRHRWIERFMPMVSISGIIAMAVLTVAVGRDNLLKVGALLILACLVHNIGGYVIGYFAARLLRMNKQDARTIAIEVGMQNCGLVSGIAASLGKVATVGLAAIIFGPIMNTTASMLANWWRLHPVQSEDEHREQASSS